MLDCLKLLYSNELEEDPPVCPVLWGNPSAGSLDGSHLLPLLLLMYNVVMLITTFLFHLAVDKCMFVCL